MQQARIINNRPKLEGVLPHQGPELSLTNRSPVAAGRSASPPLPAVQESPEEAREKVKLLVGLYKKNKNLFKVVESPQPSHRRLNDGNSIGNYHTA